MTPEHWERLVLHPACDLLLLESPHPVLALWQMALHGGETVRELDAVCSLALKKRPGHRIDPIPLDAAAWRDRLQAAFGIEKEREFDARIAGV